MKKRKEYIYTALITMFIICIFYFIRGIFPFGDNSVIWSDMHEQITAMYYHFYDAIYNGKSLLVDYSSGGGISFIGIIAYYIASPVTLILLLFPRDLIANAVSITVMIKMILASITCHYFLNNYFKNLKVHEKSLLSICYALSSYVLSLYVITTWMDAVYLFPIFVIGLKKLLDGDSPKVYIITLILLLTATFYMTLMILLFTIFASFIYLLIYRKGKDNKKIIFNLGVSTILAMLTSSIVLIPALIEVFSSTKLNIPLSNITNSKLGPLTDKVAFFFSLAPLCALTLMQILNYKKDKKNTIFIIIMLLLLGLPIIIEPINKLWHFGNYVYFPYRYGYIMTLLLVGISAYYLNNYKHKKAKIFDNNILIPTITSICTIIITLFVTLRYKIAIIKELDKLTITGNKKVAILLLGIFILYLISVLIIIYTNDYKKKIIKALIFILTLTNILFNVNLYIGTFDFNGILKLQYEEMNQIAKDNKLNDIYYTVDKDSELIMNFGMVTGARTYSNFTSLVDDDNFRTMQTLGYDSIWLDTEGSGGNIFTDMILANKYVISKNEMNDSFYEKYYNDKYLNYYKVINKMPYGYYIKNNKSLDKASNSFEASNIISNEIIGKDIVEIDNIFKANKGKEKYPYKSITREYVIEEKERLYLEAFIDYYHDGKYKSYNAFNIYVNDKLIIENYPNKKKTGVLFLGEFENTTVKVRIEALNNLPFRNVTIGKIKTNDIQEMLDNNQNNIDIKFDRSNINIKIDSDKDGIIMLPITYLDGLSESNNKIIKVFDNYLGIKVKKGSNNISINYMPNKLKIGFSITALGIVLTMIYFEFNRKKNIPKILLNITNIAYLGLASTLIFIYYILGIVAFIISFIIR